MHTLPCPRCGAYLDVTNEMFGERAQCEGCHHVFLVERKNTLGPKVPVAQPIAPPPNQPSSGSKRARAQRYSAKQREAETITAPDDDILASDVRPGTGLAITSMIVGICAVVFGVGAWFICCPFVQTLPGVVAIIFGYLGVKTEGRGMAIAGMILGAIAALLSIIPIIFFGAFFSTINPKPPPPPAFGTTPMTTLTTKSVKK